MDKRDMAIEVIEEASKESSEATFTLSRWQSEKYEQYLREAYGYCDKIDDTTLEKIHLDLPHHFRNELCQHLYLNIKSEELPREIEEMNPDVIENEIEALTLSGKFINWYNANRDDFNVP